MFSESEYNDVVIKRIYNIIKKNSISQSELAKKCNIGQSTLSKLLNNEVKFTLQHIYKICVALNIDPGKILSFNEVPNSSFDYKESTKSSCFFTDNFLDSPLFITNPTHQAFNGYTNVEHHLYAYSTISTESKLLHGILSFKNSEDNRHCNVFLTLFTGKNNKDGTPAVKKYHGQLIISITMSVCYICLVSKDIGEMCFISFKHFYLFSQDLVCRVATISSTSSGGNKLPIVQRILISKFELNISDENSEDVIFLKGQLRLNNSEIIISKKKYDKYFDALKENQNNRDLSDFFAECEEFKSHEQFIIIDESKIRSINADAKIKSQAISILRSMSHTLKYNKISNKSDEFTYNYIDANYNVSN